MDIPKTVRDTLVGGDAQPLEAALDSLITTNCKHCANQLGFKPNNPRHHEHGQGPNVTLPCSSYRLRRAREMLKDLVHGHASRV